MAKISLKNVTKTYPAPSGRLVSAVSDLNLEIGGCELAVLTGPPKCGLSSILRMIAGLDDISKGDIFVGDRRINELPPRDRDVALVSGGYRPYPRMSVYENLAFGLKRRRFPGAEIKKRVTAAAEILELGQLLERTSDFLSREERQLAAIARGVALQPKLFLFDEPLAGLEEKTRTRVRTQIAKLHQRLQTTMIYATHDPVEAMALGGRIVALGEGGAVQQDGTAAALYDKPANVLVAEFLGSPSMNLVRGILKQDRDCLFFSEADEGTIQVRLPISEFAAARDLVGKPVLLGIRPEEIRMAESPKAEKFSGSFPAIVELVEAMGACQNLQIQTGAHQLICRVPRDSEEITAGRRSHFCLNLNNLRVFDPASTLRLV